MILWSLWRRRNTKLWESILEQCLHVMARAKEVFSLWQFAHKETHNRKQTSRIENTGWMHPL
ncbi:hypothetical protein MtrunA17_Chr4g0063781 [Medicago truncatula]|uniref:Uncharacterized protein n=1 Tax=Medicago truncatula TaxID=3880 RepID=A0A396IHZ9_MEDTR|nr:hypothetical protein MtrunA17_Chr4g0063781 [Medicago truncatula]